MSSPGPPVRSACSTFTSTNESPVDRLNTAERVVRRAAIEGHGPQRERRCIEHVVCRAAGQARFLDAAQRVYEINEVEKRIVENQQELLDSWNEFFNG
jgi:hypothetical protein